MYTKIDSRPIKSIVYPGNISNKTRFQEVEHFPNISFKLTTNGSVYHIFTVYELSMQPFMVYIGKEFQKGIIYPPINISPETVQKITKLINSEV